MSQSSAPPESSAYAYTASPIQTIAGFGDDAVRNVCAIIQPLFAPLVDATGAPLTVRVASILADEEAQYPQVAVQVRLGPQPINSGDNIVAIDRTPGGYATFGEEATDSQIVFEIAALDQAQRTYLMSYLRWSMQTAYAVLPSGATQTAIVLHKLDDAGIVSKRFAADQAPEPRLSDDRPYGQIYRATVTLVADIACAWYAPLSPYPRPALAVTALPATQGQGGAPMYLPGALAPVPSLVSVTRTIIP